MNKKNILVKFSNVSVIIRNKIIIESINSNIYKNKINVFWGISGVGKSSLYKAFLRESNFFIQGDIRWYNLDDSSNNISNFSNFLLYSLIINPYIRVVKQNSNNVFSPFFTIGYHFKNLNINYSKQQIIKYFNLLKLNGAKIWNSYCLELSGGMLQRINLLFSLLWKPKLIILDEFLSSLDFINKLWTLKFLIKFAKKYNITIWWITHNIKLSLKFSDYTTIIRQDKTISFSNLTSLLNNEIKNNISILDKII